MNEQGRGGSVAVVRDITQRHEADDNIAIDSIDVATQLYRIAEEDLTNAVRHAQASEVVMALAVDGERIRLEIIDDGNGKMEEGGEGMGLRIMRFRAGMAGGALSLSSVPGRGTRVSCSCPISAVDSVL